MCSVGFIGRYRFGSFELQPDKRRLLKDSATLSLRERAFDLLVALDDRAGHLVTKDELLGRVWPKMLGREPSRELRAGVRAFKTHQSGRSGKFACSCGGGSIGAGRVGGVVFHMFNARCRVVRRPM